MSYDRQDPRSYTFLDGPLAGRQVEDVLGEWPDAHTLVIDGFEYHGVCWTSHIDDDGAWVSGGYGFRYQGSRQ